MSEKSLSDFGVPERNTEFEKESQSLKNFVGQELKVIGLDFKKLGSFDGVVIQTKYKHKDKDGNEWDKIHTTSKRVTEKLRTVDLGDDILTITVVSGKTDNGTWYDIK